MFVKNAQHSENTSIVSRYREQINAIFLPETLRQSGRLFCQQVHDQPEVTALPVVVQVQPNFRFVIFSRQIRRIQLVDIDAIASPASAENVLQFVYFWVD